MRLRRWMALSMAVSSLHMLCPSSLLLLLLSVPFGSWAGEVEEGLPDAARLRDAIETIRAAAQPRPTPARDAVSRMLVEEIRRTRVMASGALAEPASDGATTAMQSLLRAQRQHVRDLVEQIQRESTDLTPGERATLVAFGEKVSALADEVEEIAQMEDSAEQAERAAELQKRLAPEPRAPRSPMAQSIVPSPMPAGAKGEPQ